MWLGDSSSRQEQSPASPGPPHPQVPLLEGQAAGRPAGAEAVGSHACRGFFTCPFESCICRGANEKHYSQMGTWGR